MSDTAIASNNVCKPLSAAPAGARVVVQEVRGGHSVLSRLATLGFTPGALLTVVQNFGRGPLIVAVRDARIALGRGEAGSIQVIAEKNGDSANEPLQSK
jgi:ferrous iron transport protein A